MKDTLHILIVEDSSVVRERLVQKLSQLRDVEITGSGDFTTALKSFQDTCPEVVILDLQLPDGNGLDLLEAIRKRRPATLVAILTNNSGPRVRRESLARGADFFFDKSTELENMFAAITHWRTAKTRSHRKLDL